MEQLRVSIDSTKTSLKQAQEALTRQQQLYKQGLTPKEKLDNAENLVRMRQADAELGRSGRSRRSGCA